MGGTWLWPGGALHFDSALRNNDSPDISKEFGDPSIPQMDVLPLEDPGKSSEQVLDRREAIIPYALLSIHQESAGRSTALPHPQTLLGYGVSFSLPTQCYSVSTLSDACPGLSHALSHATF